MSLRSLICTHWCGRVNSLFLPKVHFNLGEKKKMFSGPKQIEFPVNSTGISVSWTVSSKQPETWLHSVFHWEIGGSFLNCPPFLRVFLSLRASSWLLRKSRREDLAEGRSIIETSSSGWRGSYSRNCPLVHNSPERKFIKLKVTVQALQNPVISFREPLQSWQEKMKSLSHPVGSFPHSAFHLKPDLFGHSPPPLQACGGKSWLFCHPISSLPRS